MSRHRRSKQPFPAPMFLVGLGLLSSLLVYAAGFLPAQPFAGLISLAGPAQVASVSVTRANLTLKLPIVNSEYIVGYPIKVQWVKTNIPSAWRGQLTLKDAAGVNIYNSGGSAQTVSSTNNSYTFTLPPTPNLGNASLAVEFTDPVSGQSAVAKQEFKLISNPNILLRANFDSVSLAAKLSWEVINVPKHWLGRVSVYGPGIFNRVIKDKLPVTSQTAEFIYPLDYMAAGNYQFTLEFYDPTKTQTGTVKIVSSVYKPE